jgi:putative flippase GtrA
MPKAVLLKKFFRFVFVGGLATGLQYAMLITLVSLWQWQATLASSLGFAASAVVNYWLNYQLTFRAKSSHKVAAFRFSVTAGTGLLLNGAIVHLGTTYTPFPYLWSQIAATLAVLFWNFIGSLKWTYVPPLRKSA